MPVSLAKKQSSMYIARYLVLLIGICILTAGIGYVSRASGLPTQNRAKAPTVTPSNQQQDLQAVQASCEMQVSPTLSLHLDLKQGKAKILSQGATNKIVVFKDNALYSWIPGSTSVTAYTNKQQSDFGQIIMNEITNNNASMASTIQMNLAQTLSNPTAGFDKYCQNETNLSDDLFNLPAGAQIVQK